MQTFLPYKDFDKSAQALDSKRLNKQILECYQILKVLSNPDPRAGWRNHPAVKMWRGYEHLLLNYTMTMVAEADKRGIKTDKNVANIMALCETEGMYWGSDVPAWYEDDIVMKRLTTTHKANLYKKDPMYYFDFFSSLAKSNPCCPNRKEPCKYYWVAHEEKYAVA
jgi:hypothetical protein